MRVKEGFVKDPVALEFWGRRGSAGSCGGSKSWCGPAERDTESGFSLFSSLTTREYAQPVGLKENLYFKHKIRKKWDESVYRNR